MPYGCNQPQKRFKSLFAYQAAWQMRMDCVAGGERKTKKETKSDVAIGMSKKDSEN